MLWQISRVQLRKDWGDLPHPIIMDCKQTQSEFMYWSIITTFQGSMYLEHYISNNTCHHEHCRTVPAMFLCILFYQKNYFSFQHSNTTSNPFISLAQNNNVCGCDTDCHNKTTLLSERCHHSIYLAVFNSSIHIVSQWGESFKCQSEMFLAPSMSASKNHSLDSQY